MSDVVDRLNAALEGRYRIERELGEGGMATVYLADDLRHERKVALKVLKPELAAVVGGDRFLAEIKTTANLQHPHILPLFDSGEAGGFLFYVMPYVEGETLRDRIDREKQLPVDEALGIATAVANALQTAHDAGIVHRDIKPGNILLSRGEPLVADFGIALAVSAGGGNRLTETGLSVGTPYYMSPEQATGDQTIGPASDTYALACVLYEMLVGEPPYLGNTAQAVLGKIIQGVPVSATSVRKAVPPNVDAAIRKALEKLPADRFVRAGDFAKALSDHNFRWGDETAAGAAGARGLWNPLSVATTALSLAFAAVAGWALLRPVPTPLVSRWPVTLPEGLAVDNSSGVNLAWSPDGTRFVFVGVTPEGASQLWMRPVDQLLPVPMRDTENARSPVFSPEGDEVAFLRDGPRGGLLLIASVSGAPLRTLVTDSVQVGSGGIAWGSDGMLYFTKTGAAVWRVSSDGGEAEEVTTLEGVGHDWPETLPDGRGLLVTLNYGDALQDSIAVFSFETGQVTTLFQGAMARYSASGHIVYASGEGTLFGVPFDPDRLVTTGPSRTLVEGIQVNNGGASQFALSKSGALAYRPGDAGTNIAPTWVGRDGSTTPLDTALSGSFQAPAISPDGRRIAFQHTPPNGVEGIWVYDIEQGTRDVRVLGDGSNNERPFWRGNEEIGFLSTTGGQTQIYGIAADGSEGMPHLVRDEADVFEALWTPDQRGLIYRHGTTSGNGDSDLYYVAADPDSVARPIVDNPYSVYSPALSPDGRCLAYTSDESGQGDEVYMQAFPGPGGRVPISIGGGSDAVWSPNGTAILYVGLDGYLVVADVRTSPDCAVLTRMPHADWPGPWDGTTTQDFDISPVDGRILILLSSSQATEANDIVVQNFFEELRERVGEGG